VACVVPVSIVLTVVTVTFNACATILRATSGLSLVARHQERCIKMKEDAMCEYEVSFVYDYATIVVSDNLARDYDHALEEARYWMKSSGISTEHEPVSISVRRVEMEGDEV
jgi:hypothetical protein